MSMSRTCLVVGVTLFACGPSTAQAQQPYRPERPYRGIFAGGIDYSGQSLTANGSLSAGYDDNLLANATNSSIQNQQGGTFGQGSASLNYALNAERANFSAAAGTSQRYYPALQDNYFDTYHASIAGSVVVKAKPAVSIRQALSYQPYTFLSAFPGELDPPVGEADVTDPDVVPLAEQYIAYSGGANLRHQLSRRTFFNANWDYRMTNRDVNALFRQSAGASLSMGMTRDLSLRLGYDYTRATYDDRVTEVHRPIISLDFQRGLSLTRRTTFTGGVGTEVTAYDGVTRYNATGHATLSHEIGRSWTASANYQRGTYFVDTFSEPLTGDSASLQLNGLITRRIQLQAIWAASLGQMGYSTRDFNSWRGTVSLSSAITRWMSVGVNYAYYRYEFDEGVELDPGVSSEVRRQSIRAHVSFFAPIYNSVRRANATR